MKQEIGETRDAIIESDEKEIHKILEANKHLRDPYWIVLFAKPAKVCIDGKYTLAKHIKAYKTKPDSQVGMCVAKVDNVNGTMEWELNMPDAPINEGGLFDLGAKEQCAYVVETTTIPDAYVTQ